jgi:hypothetical protein
MPHNESLSGVAKTIHTDQYLLLFMSLIQFPENIGIQLALAMGTLSAVSGSTGKVGKRMPQYGKNLP